MGFKVLLFAATVLTCGPGIARADELSCADLLSRSPTDFAKNVHSLLQSLGASDKIDLPGAVKEDISKQDKKGIKTILLVLAKKTGEVAKKIINVVDYVNKAYDLLVASIGPCDDVGACSQVKTQQCAIRWLHDTSHDMFEKNLKQDKACAQNLLTNLLKTQ